MDEIEEFVTAAESRSFTRAAELLGVTQAATSQHVAALEKQVGASLFDRGPRSVTLTDTGRRVYEHAKRILELVDEIRQEAGRAPATVAGTIQLACSTVPSDRKCSPLSTIMGSLDSQIS